MKVEEELCEIFAIGVGETDVYCHHGCLILLLMIVQGKLKQKWAKWSELLSGVMSVSR